MEESEGISLPSLFLSSPAPSLPVGFFDWCVSLFNIIISHFSKSLKIIPLSQIILILPGDMMSHEILSKLIEVLLSKYLLDGKNEEIIRILESFCSLSRLETVLLFLQNDGFFF